MADAPARERATALRFVVLLGFVSLLADVTYEGARSITGPYLSLMGAGAAAVGLVAGAGELIGYALRLASGYLVDRTRRYWVLAIAGYFVNLLSVPLLALTRSWPAAAALIIAERTGKAMRAPARDAMLSHATHSLGRGWGFGLHEAMDQIGGLSGPLLIAGVLAATGGGYRTGFAVLAIPAALALATLLAARSIYPHPHLLERKTPRLEGRGLTRSFWLYAAAAGLLAAGFADFPLAAYHLKKVSLVPDAAIPLFYALAMGVDAVAALVFGRLFDRAPRPVLASAALLSAAAPPLVFLGSFRSALAGMALWGAGMGAQDSVFRAVVAELVPPDRRGSAYGVFNTVYGVMWFAGSAAMGFLYDRSAALLTAFAVTAQLASIPLLMRVDLAPTSRR